MVNFDVCELPHNRTSIHFQAGEYNIEKRVGAEPIWFCILCNKKKPIRYVKYWAETKEKVRKILSVVISIHYSEAQELKT